jgi:hypothetical protein
MNSHVIRYYAEKMLIGYKTSHCDYLIAGTHVILEVLYKRKLNEHKNDN